MGHCLEKGLQDKALSFRGDVSKLVARSLSCSYQRKLETEWMWSVKGYLAYQGP